MSIARSPSRSPSRLTVGVVLLATTLLMMGITSLWPKLFTFILEEFDPSRTTLTLATMWGSAVLLVAAPLADRIGARPLIVLGGVVGAVGALLLSIATTMPVVLASGFLLAASSALAGGTIIRVLAAHWFVRWRGSVLGLLLLPSGFSFVFDSLNFETIDAAADNWRMVPRLAAFLGGAVALLARIWLRSAPAGYDTPRAAVRERRLPAVERKQTASEVLSDRTVWLVVVILGLAAVCVTAAKADLLLYFSHNTPEPITVRGEGFIGHSDPVGYPVGVHQLARIAGGLMAGFWADLQGYRRPLVASTVLSLISGGLFFGIEPGRNWDQVALPLVLSGLGLGGLTVLVALRFVDSVGVKVLGTLSLVLGFIVIFGSGVVTLATTLVPRELAVSATLLLSLGLLPVAAMMLVWLPPFPRLGPPEGRPSEP